MSSESAAPPAWRLKDWGLIDYETASEAMQSFTANRDATALDELWFCQHPAVFTQGLAGKPEHLLTHDNGAPPIPVVQSNRGGQITYHGPGQLIAYPLVDLSRRGYFIKEFVFRLEESIIRTLAHFGITGHRLRHAPGVYVRMDDPHSHAVLSQNDSRIAGSMAGLAKIAALGIKVSRHCTYHGLSLNVAMDLRPYERINPCGYAGLHSLDMQSCGIDPDTAAVQSVLAEQLIARLS